MARPMGRPVGRPMGRAMGIPIGSPKAACQRPAVQLVHLSLSGSAGSGFAVSAVRPVQFFQTVQPCPGRKAHRFDVPVRRFVL